MNKYHGLNMELDTPTQKKLIFSELFILQNKIQTQFDKLLDEITSKQFIILMITNSFPTPPSLTDISKHAGCSRQNIKKIVAVLETKGFVKLMQEEGSRAIRIHLQKKFYDFYEQFIQISETGIDKLFYNVNEEQIHELFRSLHKIEDNIDSFLVRNL